MGLSLKVAESSEPFAVSHWMRHKLKHQQQDTAFSSSNRDAILYRKKQAVKTSSQKIKNEKSKQNLLKTFRKLGGHVLSRLLFISGKGNLLLDKTFAKYSRKYYRTRHISSSLFRTN